MLPLLTAGGMATLSIAGSASANSQAKANANATAASLLQNFRVTQNSILEQADEINKQVGMELTQVELDGLKKEATTSVVVVEKNVVGATAMRLQEQVDTDTTLLSNQLKQKAESNMKEIQTNLTNSRYQYEAGSMQNAIELSNNTTSGVGILAGAVSAGVQGYSVGSSLGGITTTPQLPDASTGVLV